MEFFSHVHPATPLVLYLPVIGYMLYAAFFQSKLSVLIVAGLFPLGVLSWTLLEYIIHRYVFHYEPKSHFGKQLHFIVHGVHHDYPNDARRFLAETVPSASSLQRRSRRLRGQLPTLGLRLSHDEKIGLWRGVEIRCKPSPYSLN